MPIEKPVLVPIKVSDPQSYSVEKPVPVEVKPYSVSIKVPVNKPHEVYETKSVVVSVKNPSHVLHKFRYPSSLVGRIETSRKICWRAKALRPFLRPQWSDRESFTR